MRIVQIQLKCGGRSCSTVAAEGDGTVITRTISLDGKTPVEFEICKKHNDDLDFELEPYLADGRPTELKKAPSTAKKKTPKDGYGHLDTVDLTCKHPVCVSTHRAPAKSTTGLAVHVTRAHGYKNLAEYFEEHPRSG